ncbi:hypothetical protein FHS19_000307 [Paenibacillus rhizosphaerae]|uniref:F5/8 type C domain-containing protein n=1 Tax=Paenibacillus rhizosphaerae TaxID=297318 RepID=A0A839TGM8_9BACL|nr:hypothetical protein [Paenibacillus rhizosphaerae]MBB3125653.1 hypothetical protein [Paenibacillus rhizosphaerae]
MARQDSYFSRINGTVVQGSNDLTEWTALRSPAQSTADWQVLSVNGKEAYRYIRMYNAGTWFGNMRICGFTARCSHRSGVKTQGWD